MHQLRTMGGLNCRIVQAQPDLERPDRVVILCHGFGAGGDDLVPIGPELCRLRRELLDATRFIFPEAPLSLAEQGMPFGRAWWMLDVMALQQAIQLGEFRNLRNDNPDGLPEAREKLMALIDEVRGETGLPMSRIVLGGFSQGSMLTTDVALRLDEPPAALCVWSGTLLNETEWRELAAKRESLRILQSHGRTDPILPFEAALWLRDLFAESGFDGEFIEFPGIHTIPPEAIVRFADLLADEVQ